MSGFDLKEEDPPEQFVDWDKTETLLSQANTGGIKCSLFVCRYVAFCSLNPLAGAALTCVALWGRLMRLDGNLLVVAGETQIEKIIAALVANIWKTYDAGAKKAYGADSLYFMIIDCDVSWAALGCWLARSVQPPSYLCLVSPHSSCLWVCACSCCRRASWR